MYGKIFILSFVGIELKGCTSLFVERSNVLRNAKLRSRHFLNSSLKTRTNGLASRRKLKTWVYLRIRLAMARACVHLRWLGMTWAHFGRYQICTQVKTSFSPFGRPTQVNSSWVTSINLLLANEIQDMFAKTCKFDLDQSERKLSQVNASARKAWPNGVASRPKFSTCVCLRVR